MLTGRTPEHGLAAAAGVNEKVGTLQVLRLIGVANEARRESKQNKILFL